MALSKYAGTDLARVPGDVGVAYVVSTAADQTLCLGTSIPCKEVYIVSAGSNLKVSYVSFASAYVTKAVPIPIVSSTAIHSSLGIAPPLRFAIDDANKLWFYIITQADEVSVMYRK